MGSTDARDRALNAEVLVYDGFEETSSRIVFPYGAELQHLSEGTPPSHMTILASGEVENEPKPLGLGGEWTRAQLEKADDDKLRALSAERRLQINVVDATREELLDGLVGTPRDLKVKERALIAFPVPQTMTTKAAAAHLATQPNANFVWTREDGTAAVVHCWRARFNEEFRSAFRCHVQNNPDRTVFSARAVSEFRRAMRAVFGPDADEVPLVFARKTTPNSQPVLVGGQEQLLAFLKQRPTVVAGLGIHEVLDDGFIAKVEVGGATSGTKQFTLPHQGKSVIYMKEGYEKMACSKPLFLFNAECKLGRRLDADSELLMKLTDPSV